MPPPRKRQGTAYADVDGRSDIESAHDESGSDTAEASITRPTVRKKGKESNHVKILKKLYGGGEGSISIVFGDNENVYDFPKTLLTRNFLYFRLALRTQSCEAVYAEGERQKVHFEDIDIKTFATLHIWVSDKATGNPDHTRYFWAFAKKEERDVNHLLQVAIAADYLGLDHYQEFEEYLNQGLALSILMDRRVLTQRALDLVTSHEAFKSQLFWATMVKAGVRPALQEHMLGMKDKKTGSAPGFGQKGGFEFWDGALKHCQKLRNRKRNSEYAAAVLNELTATLVAGGERGKLLGDRESGALLYRDPLRDVYKEIPYSTGDVDHDFTM